MVALLKIHLPTVGIIHTIFRLKFEEMTVQRLKP
jgi:hypothetical protein